MIHVENLSKEFKKYDRRKGLGGAFKDLFHRDYKIFKAVESVSFNINEGDIVGFLGPNGAGKTTTIKLLTGIMQPTTGEIKVARLDPFTDRKKLAQNIGVVFGKRSNLLWDVSVNDGFSMLIDIYNQGTKGKERLKELKKIVNIDPLLTMPVRKLSLGQRTLCEVVASVLHSPKILFLDEPTIGLDLFSKDAVRELIRYINKNWGTTIFLTTHDLSDVKKLAKNVILISKGKNFYSVGLDNLLQKVNELPQNIIFSMESIPYTLENDLESFNGIYSTNKECENKLVISYDPIKLSQIDIIKNVMDATKVTDIKIPEIDIEDILRDMYIKNKEGAYNA